LLALGSLLVFGTAAAFTQVRSPPEFGNSEAPVMALDNAGPGTYASPDQFNRYGHRTVIGNTVSNNARIGLDVTCPSNVTNNTVTNIANKPENFILNGEGRNNTNKLAP
jgi:hypothetical protein